LKGGSVVSLSNDTGKNTLKVVEETLVDLLGREATQAIFTYLGNRYHLTKEEIPLQMDAFQAHLEELLGKATTLIMKQIEERIHQQEPTS
jgi:hypothetical protein